MPIFLALFLLSSMLLLQDLPLRNYSRKQDLLHLDLGSSMLLGWHRRQQRLPKEPNAVATSINHLTKAHDPQK